MPNYTQAQLEAMRQQEYLDEYVNVGPAPDGDQVEDDELRGTFSPEELAAIRQQEYLDEYVTGGGTHGR